MKNFKNICEWSQYFSEETWERISFAQNRNGFKIYETTITQNLIFSLLKHNFKLTKIYESTNEYSNGNDMELFIKHPNLQLYYRFDIQAKISYKNEKFEKINHYHPSKNSYQIEDLIKYSVTQKSEPLYFFYSYTKLLSPTAKDKRNNFYSHFGVTVVSAKSIFAKYFSRNGNKFIKIPTVKDIIQNKGLTLHEFLCIYYPYRESVIENINKYSQLVIAKMPETNLFNSENLHEENEITKDRSWNLVKSIKNNGHENKKIINDHIFNPKFRIVIENE